MDLHPFRTLLPSFGAKQLSGRKTYIAELLAAANEVGSSVTSSVVFIRQPGDLIDNDFSPTTVFVYNIVDERDPWLCVPASRRVCLCS